MATPEKPKTETTLKTLADLKTALPVTDATPVDAGDKLTVTKTEANVKAVEEATAPPVKKPVARLDDLAPMPNPAKARKPKRKAEPAPAPVAEVEPVKTKEQEELENFEPDMDDETTRQYVEANEREKAALESPKDEPAEEEYETVTELHEEVIINLPLRKCNRCLHLMPTMTRKLPKDMGGHVYGHEFDCFDRSDCPAHKIKLVYNPFSNERITEAVTHFNETGDLGEVTNMYAEAKKISKGVFDELHSRVVQTMGSK